MRYLLDTNVISEFFRKTPDVDVTAWLKNQSSLDLAISVLVLGELEKGIAMLPAGKRRAQIERWAHEQLPLQFIGRLLPVDDAVALAWGQLSGRGQTEGRTLPVVDGLLLATALVHNVTFATRNVEDCAGRGVPVFDPWSGELYG